MRKVCVVVTARPSYSRIKSALKMVQDHPDLDLQLVVAASALLERYGNAASVIEAEGFEIAARVHMVIEGESPLAMAKTTGLGLIELATVFDNLRPDIVVTIADRYETLATAVTASYTNLPLVHIQGGEVTGSVDEKVRHAITKLATLHFVATEKAAERVVRMGESPETVFVTGCPSIDLAAEMIENPGFDSSFLEDYGGVGRSLDLSEGYLVVLQHPVTTEHQLAQAHVEETLFAVKELGMPTFWFWPNVDAGSDGTSKGIRVFREREGLNNVHFFRNLNPAAFLRLVDNCSCIIGNSSVAIRECEFLGVPAVNIGSRQTGRDRGLNVVDAEYKREAIKTGILHWLGKGKISRGSLYGDGRAGQRIAELLAKVPLTVEKRLTY